MVLSREDFMKKIKEKIGDDSSDESLKFIEDMNDTYDDLAKKGNPNKKTDEEWEKHVKEQVEAKDNEWRERYKARFFDGVEDDGANGDDKTDPLLAPTEKKPTPEETITVDDLFKESEDK